ncbi:MAG: hypothetical protein HY855_21775 [Burkholderiales bacterium]|nr:hypothetical protein [Burkholderiales bacterium]
MAASYFAASMDLEELPQGVRYPHLAVPEAVVRTYVQRYSRPGDVVFDPFAGYGSTLTSALALGRQACGVELDPERLDHARQRLAGRAVLHQGDARHLDALDLPACQLCLTGPPFFRSSELMQQDIPSLAPAYDDYLDELTGVFQQVARRLLPGGHVVALFANMRVPRGFWHPGSAAGVLPLAWDAARAIGRCLDFLGEEIWCIEKGPGHSPFAGRHGYFLLFGKPAAAREAAWTR